MHNSSIRDYQYHFFFKYLNESGLIFMQKFYEPEEIWVVWNKKGIVSRDDFDYYLRIYVMIFITI